MQQAPVSSHPVPAPSHPTIQYRSPSMTAMAADAQATAMPVHPKKRPSCRSAEAVEEMSDIGLLMVINVVLQIFPLLELQRSLLVTRRCYARRYLELIDGGCVSSRKYLQAGASCGTPGPTSPSMSSLYLTQGRGFKDPRFLPPLA
jgi:hypothetical protein